MAELRLILVTPEETLFDRPVAWIRLPLYDGSAGIFPGRAPLVGRLGIGALVLAEVGSQAETTWFIDGGFVQVKGSSVSVLTNSAVAPADISRKDASAKLTAAKDAKARTDEEYEAASRKLERARKMLNLAGKE